MKKMMFYRSNTGNANKVDEIIREQLGKQRNGPKGGDWSMSHDIGKRIYFKVSVLIAFISCITVCTSDDGSSNNPVGGNRCITFECPTCHGSGKCSMCAGRGYTIINGSMVDCRICSGTGRCGGCYGKGTITRCD